MELNTFITDVLKQIQTGVKNANGGKDLLHIAHIVEFHRYDDSKDNEGLPIEYINFDIAFTSSKSGKNVEVLLSSGEAKEKTVQTKVNFRVPIYWKTKESDNPKNRPLKK
jgi:hypothetical protein